MPKVTNKKIRYEGKDGAVLKCSIRSDSGGDCRYVRFAGRRPQKKGKRNWGTDYFSIDVCVDCGTVYFKNHPGFRVDSSAADLLRMALFQVKKILETHYNLGPEKKGVQDVFGINYSGGAKIALSVIEKALSSEKKAQ